MRTTLTVSAERLRSDIEANADIGAVESETGSGRTVLTGTDADRRARDRFVARLEDAGLSVDVDPVGNVVGTWIPPGVDPSVSPVVTGSHLDSVPSGGIFDGVLGVYGGLEAIRTLQESSVQLQRPLAVVSFTEEEGHRFPQSTLGSAVATGSLSVDDALALTDAEGRTLETELSRIGYHGTDTVQAETWDSWLELHVEQGRRLAESSAIGVVTSISGYMACDVSITGVANHAGATPMDTRSDALTAASEFVLDVESAAIELSGGTRTTVGTVGELAVSPDVSNVVPGQVDLSVDIRDVDEDTMRQLESRVQASLALLESRRGVTTSFERRTFDSPTTLDDSVRTAVADAAESAGFDAQKLHSGAFHDTRNVARRTDAGMVFAPSEGGISHSPDEWTDWDDCARATTVLATALAALAT
jgi:N-carbamoyl-L-amino-acid hydrolase